MTHWFAAKILDKSAYGIAVDPNDGTVYFTCDGVGLCTYDRRMHQTELLVALKGQGYGLVWDNKKLCMCHRKYISDDGIQEYDIDNRSLNSISPFSANQICGDQRGTLYCTDRDGVSSFVIHSRTFRGINGHRKTKSNLDTPTGITAVQDGYVYVCDTRNYCIRRIKNVQVDTCAGIYEKQGSNDGPVELLKPYREMSKKGHALFSFRSMLSANPIINHFQNQLLVSDENGFRLITLGKYCETIKVTPKLECQDVYCFAMDIDGKILVGHKDGIWKLEPQPWKIERLLWIGWLKEGTYCDLSAIPREIVKLIVDYLHGK